MSARLLALRGVPNRLRAAPPAALITLASGAANLYSALNLPPPALQRRLRDMPPLGFRHFPRSVALLIGRSLVVSAINIRKRRSCRIIGQPHGVDIYAKDAAPRQQRCISSTAQVAERHWHLSESERKANG